MHARFFAIMVDEVTSHNTELMSLCIRFLDEHKDTTVHSPTAIMYTICLFL